MSESNSVTKYITLTNNFVQPQITMNHRLTIIYGFYPHVMFESD